MWIRYLPDRVYAAVMDVAADDSPQQPLQQEPLAPEQLPVQQGHYAHEGKRLGEHQEQWRVDADSGVLQHALQVLHGPESLSRQRWYYSRGNVHMGT